MGKQGQRTGFGDLGGEKCRVTWSVGSATEGGSVVSGG